ncbi:hypothetical protein HK097_000963, partial [Rhizophlyctis rosea]
MPKYYCDYCDIFLTHDSPSVRKAHNSGWKHRMHVQNYYSALEPAKVQDIVDQITEAWAPYGGPPDYTMIAGPPQGAAPTQTPNQQWRPGMPSGPGMLPP